MEKLFLSLAYKYVMLTLMVGEANHALQKFDMHNAGSISMTNVVSYHITPPRMRPGGSLDTTNAIFGFGENKLQFIQFTEPDSHLSIPERQARWSTMKSLVDTNEAYRLATNWLAALEVDIDVLAKAHPVTVEQQFYYPGGDTKRSPITLPRFEVRWGTNQSRPAVWVSVFGPTKSPIHIRQEDGSFIRRQNLIKSEKIEELLAIANKDFASWTHQEKSNIVAQSSGNTYSSFVFPEPIVQSNSQDSRAFNPPEGRTKNTSQKKTRTVLPSDKAKP